MADYELIGLNEAAPDLRAPTSADRGVVVGGVLVEGLAELDGGADILGDPVATLSRTNPLARAIAVQMTAAASGSDGIRSINNVDTQPGTGDYGVTVVFKTNNFFAASLDGFVVVSREDANNQWYFGNFTGNTIRAEARVGGVVIYVVAIDVSAAIGAAKTDGNVIELGCWVKRETASAAGEFKVTLNGVNIGTTAITASATVDISNAGFFEVMGNNGDRLPCDYYSARFYNRYPSDAEILDLAINGVALADRGASQTGDLVTNGDFATDTDWTKGSSWTIGSGVASCDGASGTFADRAIVQDISARESVQFEITVDITDTASGPNAILTFWVGSPTAFSSSAFVWTKSDGSGSFKFLVKSSAGGFVGAVGSRSISSGDLFIGTIDNITCREAGLTSELLASNAQSDTGQIFDSSGNKNHALLPASGATVVGRPVSQTREVRWTNTWDGTNELQYIGGVNQAILPANAYIESIVGTVSGATPHDIIVGDGSDTDRYVTITTGLAAGTTSFALANRTTDGTNLKLTVDPDTNATMSIAWVIRFSTLEA